MFPSTLRPTAHFLLIITVNHANSYGIVNRLTAALKSANTFERPFLVRSFVKATIWPASLKLKIGLIRKDSRQGRTIRNPARLQEVA